MYHVLFLVCLLVVCVSSLLVGNSNFDNGMGAPSCVMPIVHEDVLTPAQCQGLIDAAKEMGLERSTVLDKNNSVSPIRTSTQVFVPKNHPACRPLIKKVKEATGLWDETKYEDVQVLHYSPGEEYKSHFDSCHRCTDDGKDLLRVQTCLTYLNDCQHGGHTEFPKVHQRVSPKQGRMVQWHNIDEHNRILPCSFHRSCPVQGDSEKWAATIWIDR